MSEESAGSDGKSSNSSTLTSKNDQQQPGRPKEYSCTNSGCRESFKWASQLSRHKKNCTKPSMQQKQFDLINGSFRCLSCSKSYAHRPNILRHLKTCKGSQASSNVHERSYCSRNFTYKSTLERHMDQVHNAESINCRKCGICGFKFRRKDHLEAHMQKCNGIRGQDNISQNEALNIDLEVPSLERLPSFLENEELTGPSRATSDLEQNETNFDLPLMSNINYNLPIPSLDVSQSGISFANDNPPFAFIETPNEQELPGSPIAERRVSSTPEKQDSAARVAAWRS
eukprot:gene10570-11691_t